MTTRRQQLLAAAVVAAGLLAVAGPVLVLVAGDRGQAAFSGEVALGGRLSSATLDVEPGQLTVPITVAALPPGGRATGTIEVVNAGTLPLHYALLMDPPAAVVGKWLAWDLWLADPSTGCGPVVPPDAFLDGVSLAGSTVRAVFGDPAPGYDPGDRRLEPGDRELLCTAVSLPLDAPDRVQGASITPTFTVAAEHHLEARP